MLRTLTLTAACLVPLAPAAHAQDANAILQRSDGSNVATATLTQLENGVLIEAGFIEMEPGIYAFHIHETGSCSPDFEAAGGHFAPRGNTHGFDAEGGPHAGDLPNVEIGESGRATVELFNDRISLREGAEDNVLDEDGAAFILHADPDTYEDEASAGARLACGVIEPMG